MKVDIDRDAMLEEMASRLGRAVDLMERMLCSPSEVAREVQQFATFERGHPFRLGRANRVIGAVPLIATEEMDGEHHLIGFCADFDHYKRLPEVVEWEGRMFGKTGWNSDDCRVYYKSGVTVGTARR